MKKHLILGLDRKIHPEMRLFGINQVRRGERQRGGKSTVTGAAEHLSLRVEYSDAADITIVQQQPTQAVQIFLAAFVPKILFQVSVDLPGFFSNQGKLKARSALNAHQVRALRGKDCHPSDPQDQQANQNAREKAETAVVLDKPGYNDV